MSKLSKKEIEHIAKLARIHITEKEKKQYLKELSKVLDYVEKLSEVDTVNIKETSQAIGLENVYREDRESFEWKVDKDSKKNTEKLLSNTKNKLDDYVKVKQILS